MSQKSSTTRTLTDFTGPAAESAWRSINDTVMGGHSEGVPAIRDGILHFTGHLSLDNNAGFASVRGREQQYDLSDSESLQIRVNGDGRTYQIRLYTNARYQDSKISYAASFSTPENQWTTVRVPLNDLTPTFRGRELEGPAFDPSEVTEIGFLIADKRDGPFQLLVDWIKGQSHGGK
ncbi:Complex I intermediate-associated protein 30 (CIA30) [Marinobacter daqiaonensis]|uniref:Complex I intermediate-associated protein 30 (CIA30) n=1 Tax=Marinobacter daqiaonensis TaxID=650891 RepID=A0A1I6GY94_9GAMM|nr:CIA30 family protein [Marinobacter daqiaonensis]SFR47192.1 Complex I intermediate-associated protein 30 (CIA30) [Marinobacter daqiaonensis]